MYENIEESISLRYIEGNSDKVYKVSLYQESNGGWLVDFAYGRYPRATAKGTKTKTPVPYKKAHKIYQKVVSEKLKKGYYPELDPNSFVRNSMIHRAKPKSSGFRPQLLNPVEASELPSKLTEWEGGVWVQVKYDGERRPVLMGSSPTPLNRRGEEVDIDTRILEQLQILCNIRDFDFILDTEDMGDHLVIFDVTHAGSRTPFSLRVGYLSELWNEIAKRGLDRLDIAGAEQLHTENDISSAIFIAKNANEEGLVFRDGNSMYTADRPNSGGPALKLKFYESASCVVLKHNEGKRSISIGLYDDNGSIVPKGNVTIPPNYNWPDVGEVVEIKYLYAYRDGSLYQPQYLGIRFDIEPDACLLSQLKYKEL